MKRADRSHSIQVFERRTANEPVGWGITLPRTSLEPFDYNLDYCHVLDLYVTSYRATGHLQTPVDLISISRDTLVRFLVKRCSSVGVDLRFGAVVDDVADIDLSRFDLVVAADGAHSLIRKRFAEYFGPTIIRSPVYHAWLATPKLFGGTLMIMFRECDGALFTAWGYQFSATLSSLIVQSTAKGLLAIASPVDSVDDGCGRVARVFRQELEGNIVLADGPVRWTHAALLKNKRWHHRNIVLIGDAAHTIHFSKGIGTQEAMRDGLSLSRHLAHASTVSSALAAFEQERIPEVSLIQTKAQSSLNWYNSVMSSYESGSTSVVVDELEAGRRRLESRVDTSGSV
jgi:anthraniloyl-CoA monooxygenase